MASKIKYKVISSFKDGKDKNKEYNVGDSYPKPANKKISEDRINELSSNSNKVGKAFIEAVEE
ncbi:hypothetical protein [Staphylococcus succinus]|uniref:hypothetical protein n=1 Tax=Staphylococcus succinus TaxID=61015 RepID=UPI00301CB367